jgi:nicotinate-nucleotide pyrophosphorylase (carboxylating)
MFYDEFARKVLAEDLGRGDLFARVGGVSRRAVGKIVAKSDGILAGEPYAEAIARYLGLEISWKKRDGEAFGPGDLIARVYGDAVALLQAERSILNTILHASSVATKAKEFADLAGGKLRVLDTRKTRPFLREFEKYAARVGGVTNHRYGLDDALMLKDTHLAILGDEFEAFMERARTAIPFTAKIEVECESFDMAKRAMEAGADIVMCDNMEIDEIRRVVELRDARYPHVLLEASGNITPQNIARYIDLGIDAISSGAIVHQATWPDISMKIEV